MNHPPHRYGRTTIPRSGVDLAMVARPAVDASVARQRRRIARIDRSLVELLATRLSAAADTIRTRTRLGADVSDLAQEDRVLERTRVWSIELGVPPALTEELFRALVLAGKERVRAGEPSTEGGEARPAPVLV